MKSNGTADINSRALLDNLHVGVVVHAPDTSIRYANPQALKLLQLTEEQISGKTALDPAWCFLDSHKLRLTPELYPVNQVLLRDQPISDQVVGITSSQTDEITWVLVNAYPEYDENKAVTQVVVTFIDISHEKKEIPFEAIVASATDAVVVTEAFPLVNEGPRIVYVNGAFTKITGYSEAEALGKTPRILQGDDTDPATKLRIHQALEQGLDVHEQILNYTKSGKPYWLDLKIVPLKNSLGEITHFAAIERDISNQKDYEQDLKQQAERDELTDLYNRQGFMPLAKAMIEQHRFKPHVMTVAMLDIDFFKPINDQHGHLVGDKALATFAELMQKSFRQTDLICRYGGEEFAILLPDINAEQAEKSLNKFRTELQHTAIKIDDEQELFLTVSIGALSKIIVQHDQIEGLLEQADQALYQAKQSGRNKVCFA